MTVLRLRELSCSYRIASLSKTKLYAGNSSTASQYSWGSEALPAVLRLAMPRKGRATAVRIWKTRGQSAGKAGGMPPEPSETIRLGD